MPSDSVSPSARGARGLTPVVGVLLMVVVAILLSLVSATLVFGLLAEPEPAPSAKVALDDGSCDQVFRHVAGEAIDGDRVELDGVEDPGALADSRLSAGDTRRLDAVAEAVEVVWSAPDAADSYVIARLDVPADAVGSEWACPGTVFTASGATIDSLEGDGRPVTTLSATSDARGLGPATHDLTGDGTTDLPFVTDSGTVALTNDSNATASLAADGDIAGTVGAAKTRLAVGAWDGSEESVFFVDENHATLYRVSPGGSPVAVASPGDGAQAVSGIGDIDGDGTDELVFADASQQLRYLEPDGSVHNVPNGQTGSNNGIGAGALADFDGDGTVTAVVVDGSNDVKLTGEATADGGEGTTTLPGPDAAKAPPAVADVDGDDDSEIVYVGLATGQVKYVDDVGGANDVAFLTDDDGDRIDGSDRTGLV